MTLSTCLYLHELIKDNKNNHSRVVNLENYLCERIFNNMSVTFLNCPYNDAREGNFCEYCRNSLPRSVPDVTIWKEGYNDKGIYREYCAWRL